MRSVLVFCAYFAVLCLWHLMSLAIAAGVVGHFISLADAGQAAVDVVPLLSVSILEVAVVVWLICRLKLAGIKLLVATLVVFHGVKIFLMMIELAFFLNIWASPPVISLERVSGLELHGLLMSLLFCPVAILLMKKWRLPGHGPSNIFPIIKRSLMGKIGVISVLYAACYWIAGGFILIPLAGESFLFTYGHLQVPAWMPFFQVGRGLLWAFIVLLLVHNLNVSGLRLYMGVGVVLAVLAGAQLLLPNPYMLGHLRYAHLVELGVSMMFFGVLASWILRSGIKEPADA